MTLSNIFNVLLVILVIAAIVLVILYFIGRKLEKRQVEQQALLEAAKQTVSILVIDKKKLKLKEAGLPKMVYEQTPKYMRWAKVPVVKAKIGSKIMTLMADDKVFAMLPVKTEAKVVISGIYITEIKTVRGGVLPLPKKKGFFARFKKNKDDKDSQNKGQGGKGTKNKDTKEKDVKTKESQSKDMKAKDSQSKNSQAQEPQGKDMKPRDSQGKDTKNKASQSKDTKGKTSQNKGSKGRRAKNKGKR